MVKSTISAVLLLIGSLSNPGGMQEPPTPWRDDPVFQRLAQVLDPVLAIDTHTHLLSTGKFDPVLATQVPLLNRSTHPWFPSIIKARFGLDVDPRDWVKEDAAVVTARAAMIKALGEHGYWMDHLDYSRTEIALVNSNQRSVIDDKRLRWVPQASTLLYPLPAEHLMARSPRHREDISDIQQDLKRFLSESGAAAVPQDLAGYVRFVDDTLRRWQKQGAVAVKFYDAYLRTLRIAARVYLMYIQEAA